MIQSYRTVSGENIFEITEKKSRFIGYICHAETEDEAKEVIASVRKKHWSAKHNVFAYRLRDDGVERMSDDSEPQGTGGIPVLSVIKGADLFDTVIVVTRYFGGILLGTGGLARAYAAAAKGALDGACVGVMTNCSFMKTRVAYPDFEKVTKLLSERGAVVTDNNFTDRVEIDYYVDSADEKAVADEIFSATAGSALTVKTEERYMALPER